MFLFHELGDCQIRSIPFPADKNCSLPVKAKSGKYLKNENINADFSFPV